MDYNYNYAVTLSTTVVHVEIQDMSEEEEAAPHLSTPAINLSHNPAPAVSHLSYELGVSGQVDVTLMERFVDLTVPVNSLGQLRLHRLQNTLLLLQICFHSLHGTRHHIK